MEQAFLEYEQHLQMFLDYGSNDHARREVGEPVKPEGYDAWKAKQGKSQEKKDGFSDFSFVKLMERLETEKEADAVGYELDSEGVARYLTADDAYNGIENPVWTQKHLKEESKPATYQKDPNEKEGVNYDEEGIPEYLTKEAYHFGEVNPAWLEKHESNKT
jgi:hypothetical protein